MSRSYFIFSGEKIGRKDNTIQITLQTGQKKSIPVEQVRDLYLFSEATLNTKLLQFISQKNILLHVFNYYGFYSGTYYPREHQVSGELLIKQVEAYQNEFVRQAIAIGFIDSAAHNIHRNIRYYNRRGRDFDKQVQAIDALRSHISRTKTIEELMGIEGNIRRHYYQMWNEIITKQFTFDKRVKRPPDTIINTLISFVNSLVYTACLSEIYKTALNPTISYLHAPGVKRFSLCLDLAEVFKPIIADRMIFKMINKGQITEKSFERKANYLKLRPDAVKKITQEFDSRLCETIQHKGLGRKVSYRSLIRMEAYKLIKHLVEGEVYQGYKMDW